jgi:hypothetical protein
MGRPCKKYELLPANDFDRDDNLVEMLSVWEATANTASTQVKRSSSIFAAIVVSWKNKIKKVLFTQEESKKVLCRPIVIYLFLMRQIFVLSCTILALRMDRDGRRHINHIC